MWFSLSDRIERSSLTIATVDRTYYKFTCSSMRSRVKRDKKRFLLKYSLRVRRESLMAEVSERKRKREILSPLLFSPLAAFAMDINSYVYVCIYLMRYLCYNDLYCFKAFLLLHLSSLLTVQRKFNKRHLQTSSKMFKNLQEEFVAMKSSSWFDKPEEEVEEEETG